MPSNSILHFHHRINCDEEFVVSVVCGESRVIQVATLMRPTKVVRFGTFHLGSVVAAFIGFSIR